MALRSRQLGVVEGFNTSIDRELECLHRGEMQTCRHYAVGTWGKWVVYTKLDKWYPIAEHLPGLRRLIEQSCNVDALEVGHVFYSERDGFLHPHRDWSEEAPLFHRVHIPLQADEGCLMTEGALLFRMSVGEAWLLDASEVHSAGCFSARPRYHLVLDMAPWADLATDLTMTPMTDTTYSIISQPVWSIEQENAFLDLAPLFAPETLEHLVALASALHFDWDLHAAHSWRLLAKLADGTNDTTLGDMVETLTSRYLGHSAK